MQTGVKFLLESEPGLNPQGECSPKHLRTGINSALIDSGAVGQLLIEKGIITEEEYFEKLADLAEADVASYTEKLEQRFGTKVTLA